MFGTRIIIIVKMAADHNLSHHHNNLRSPYV